MKVFLLSLSLGLAVGLATASPPVAGAEAPEARLALRGLDPVTVIQGDPRPGLEQHASVQGRFRYLFASAANKATFDGDPARWAFQLDGTCGMMRGTPTDGSIYAVHRGKLYAFGSAGCKKSFVESPEVQAAAGAGDPADGPTQSAAGAGNVAILVFDGVQIIDYTGPYEVFGQAGYQVFTVAAGPGPITTTMGMQVVPAYTLDTAPAAEVVVIPGGGIDAAANDPRTLAWIRARAATAAHLLTVCNGAFILARTGLLDGLTATTFYDLIPQLREEAPRVRVVADQRFVDNGKIVTTAGLSSGIDGSLHVVERLRGNGRAQQVALNMEYDWRPADAYARAALADAELRRLFGRRLAFEVPGGGTAKVLATQGTRDRWQIRWEIAALAPPADLHARLAEYLRGSGWSARAGGAGQWTYTGADRRPWTAEVDLQPLAGKAGQYTLEIRVERAG
jgi:putative intracellular protease/amidase/YHS domain-containing protein